MKIWKALAAVLILTCFGGSAGAGSPWGIAAHPHAAKEWENIDRQLGMMRDAGMTSLRHDMKFSRIAAKKGQYDFSSYDELLEKLDRYGIEFLPILEGYDWEIDKNRRDVVPLYRHPEEWRAFVRACARHYRGRLKAWEIWNEQDGGFWKPDPDAAQFVPLLKIAYEELKAADPENVVIVGGLCGWNVGYLRDMYAAGAKGYFDGIAIHPYGWGVDRSAFQEKRMKEFKAVLAQYGDAGTALWITECGGSTHRSNLIAQQPDVLIKAIGAAASEIGRKLPPQLVVGAPVSREHLDRDFESSRNWLPGVKLIPITPEELAEADPEQLPVFLGCEHTAIEESYKEPMLEYVKKGGILLAFGEVPFYYIRYRNKQGNWSSRSAAGELHPFYGIGYQAWWTKPGIPKSATRTAITGAGRKAGIKELENIYATRFLNAANVADGDKYTPLVQILDNSGKAVGDGIALYTFRERGGAILGCTIQVAGGFTEEEQAHLLQTLYLSYLAAGIERLYFYDFHSDGSNAAERENNFGIVRWDYEPKPAYFAYRELTAMLGRTPRFAGRIPGLSTSVQALLFDRAEGGRVLAFWSTSGEKVPFRYRGVTYEAVSDVRFVEVKTGR